MKTIKFNLLLGILLFSSFMVMAQKPNVHILATGGTIAGVGSSATQSNYTAGQVAIGALLDAVPEINDIANVTGEQVVRIGSQDMNDEVWLILAKRINELLSKDDIDGIVITHGTDTMEETAFFLSLTVKSDKPVVLIGAMRPSTALSADGPLNLYNAVVVASDKNSKGKGVLVTMNGVILDAHNVTKTNTTSVETFQSPNAGQIGYVYNGKPFYNMEPTVKPSDIYNFDVTKLNELPKVGIVYSYSNIDSDMITPMLNNGYKGIVHAGVGNGNIHKNVFPVLESARKKDIQVVRSSRVPTGPTTLDAEVDDAAYQFIASQSLNPQKSRVLLMLALTKTQNWQEIQKYFSVNYLPVIKVNNTLPTTETKNVETAQPTLLSELGVVPSSKKVNLLLNMRGNFDANFNDGLENGAFKMSQLRAEVKGNVNDWLSYRLRQRLNRPNNGGGNLDNMPTSIDIAGIGVKFTDEWSIFAGKQCAAYGGFQFDLNPIEVYAYSDLIENMNNFLTGLNVAYDFSPSQQINFQVLDGRNNNFEDTYGDKVKDVKLPLVYSLNWNGNFDDIFKTRWSGSLMSQAEGKKMIFVSLGNEVTIDKFNGFFDFMYSQQDLDRKGIMTGIVNDNFGADYVSCVLHLGYRIAPKWNIMAEGTYDTASRAKVSSADDALIKPGKYRTSLGYVAALEYYPMESNLHFFLSYMGRSVKHTDIVKDLNKNDFNTNVISAGFVYQLPVL